MALPKLRPELEPAAAPRAARKDGPRLADASQDLAIQSPARVLQDALAEDLVSEETRWHPAATLGFVVLTCGGFWTILGVMVIRALNHGG